MAILNFLKNIVLSGHERSVRVKKNMIALFAVKGYSIVINLTLVPVTLHLLNEYKYGVWITLFNVLGWISFFDIGVGNGLRNKFAEAMAKGQVKEAREYVSTAYIVICGIALTLIALFIIPWHLVDWARVFNVTPGLANEISWLVGIAFVLTAIQFCLKLLGTILTANHQPAIADLIVSISNTFILLAFIVGKKWVTDNLSGIGLVYTLTPILVFLIASIILFSTRLHKVRPSFGYFKKEKIKSLFGLGFRFFVVQIAVLVIFQTDTIIITHTLSPNDVTSYNIAFRYFGMVSMFAALVMTPLWSAYTEAAAKNDYAWIKQVIKKLLKGLAPVALIIFILFISAGTIIPLWLNYPMSLSGVLMAGMAAYTFISVYNNIFSIVLNGLSLTNIQMATSIMGMLVNIPLSIYFARQFGNGGVILATIISLSFFTVLGTVQTYQFLKNK